MKSTHSTHRHKSLPWAQERTCERASERMSAAGSAERANDWAVRANEWAQSGACASSAERADERMIQYSTRRFHTVSIHCALPIGHVRPSGHDGRCKSGLRGRLFMSPDYLFYDRVGKLKLASGSKRSGLLGVGDREKYVSTHAKSLFAI